MFFIFGFGHRTIQRHGGAGQELCRRCNNNVNMEIVKIRQWFTLFFIPIIPYKTEYLIICPICNNARQISKEEFEEIKANPFGKNIKVSPLSEEARYAGKTPTQIAYLKQMEEIEKNKDTGAE